MLIRMLLEFADVWMSLMYITKERPKRFLPFFADLDPFGSLFRKPGMIGHVAST
jgi:hypothetical protein